VREQAAEILYPQPAERRQSDRHHAEHRAHAARPRSRRRGRTTAGAEARQNPPDYQAQAQRPFEPQARLKELLARQAQLNAALDLDKSDAQAAEATTEP
jgi:hypothetical protein